jgi:hypothetical protein
MRLVSVVVLVVACVGIAGAEVGQTPSSPKEPLETKHELAPERGRRMPFPAPTRSHSDPTPRYQPEKSDDAPSGAHGHGGGRGGGAHDDDDDGGDE